MEESTLFYSLVVFALSLTCLIVFFLMAHNLSVIRKEIQRQSRLMKILAAAANPDMPLVGTLVSVGPLSKLPDAGEAVARLDGLPWACIAKGEVRCSDPVGVVGLSLGKLLISNRE